MQDMIEKHGLWLSAFGLAGGWTLTKVAIMAAIFAHVAAGALALYTLYLKFKNKDKE